jgi:hypothetical protein
MTTPVVIIPAMPEHVGSIAKIHADVWREALGFLPVDVLNARDFDYRHRQWSEHFDNPTGGLFSAMSEKRVVGFGYARPNENPLEAAGELHGIHLLPEHRGGINGAALAREMARWCAREGHRTLITWAFEANRYRQIYALVGFSIRHRRPRDIGGHFIPEVGYVGPTETVIAKLSALIDARLARLAPVHTPHTEINNLSRRAV